MNIPNRQKKFRKLRIISSNYIITYHKELRDEKGELIDGDIGETEKEIKVLKGMNYQRTLQVILHEALHGIKWELRFGSDDEIMNIQLTTGVTCFIRDNSEFIKEYTRILNGGKY